ncbi:MAG: S-layer homology domain-containing protein [Firmicutes bacterium]|nr:S-layer homology domain-containing protein [Bacillota bacterium]
MKEMKRFQRLSIVLCFLLMLAFAFVPQAVYAEEPPFEGNGTEADPYLITNYEDLCKLSELVNSGNAKYNSAYYLQTADIVANEGTFSVKNNIPQYNGKDIEFLHDEHTGINIIGAKDLLFWPAMDGFCGTYNGNNYILSGFCGQYGVIGFAYEATITNLIVTNSVFYNTHQYSSAAGIAINASNCLFKNCLNDADVVGYYQAGGIVGSSNNNTFEGCVNSGDISIFANEASSPYGSDIFCGGICGKMGTTVIDSCINTGSVSGLSHTGGICGYTNDTSPGKIINCINDGTVRGILNIGGIVGYAYVPCEGNINNGTVEGIGYIGGIAGMAVDNIIQCYNYGDIVITGTDPYNDSSSQYMGCGGITGRLFTDFEIAGCINTGNIEGNTSRYTGGICGTSDGMISLCANYGKLKSQGTLGGIVGKAIDRGIIAYCYNAGSVSGESVTGGILGGLFTGWNGYYSRDYLDENYVFACYNVGNITSESVYVGAISGENKVYTIDHCFYLNNSASKGIGIDYDNTANLTSMNSTEMKKASFVNTLNKEENIFAQDKNNINNGYPVIINVYPAMFDDVPGNIYYTDAVLWALFNGVTTGISDTSFGPDAPCTRGQFVTFLWRAAGCPEPKSASCAFTDCDPGQYYYDAVLWAVENGVTNGTSDTTFEPNKTVNRAEVITFLWKYDGKPIIDKAEPFTDVNDSDWFSDAVKWGYANGLANGTSATTYGSLENCTRAQTVTFLYRYFAE